MAKKYETEDGNIVIVSSLTFGYLEDVENGVVEDNISNAILNATNLSNEELRNLRRTDTLKIFDMIRIETYPDLFDENGNEIPTDINNKEDDKKKVYTT